MFPAAFIKGFAHLLDSLLFVLWASVDPTNSASLAYSVWIAHLYLHHVNCV